MTIDLETRPQTSSSTRRGFEDVPCIKCGSTNAVRVNLADASFTCGDCDETFTTADVREFLVAWTPVLKWVEMMPEL